MDRITSTLTLGLLLALTGCPGDDSSTTSDTNADGSSTGTSMGTTAGPTTDPGTTTSASADSTDGGMTTEMATTDPGTDTGMMTTDGGMTEDSGSSGGGMGGACDPDPADDACGTCVKMSCCPELEACGMDADCICFQDCAETMPGIAGALACADMCGLSVFDLMNGDLPVGALANCTQAMCPVCVE